MPHKAAADAIRGAQALLIGAGAGMGVDSGLPDFRGPEGFWRAYPPFKKRRLSFVDLANPRWFGSEPDLAWGFYGHRLQLYRDTVGHEGFTILRRWGARMRHGAFVYTSNVDGQFQKAGFESSRVVECHGSIHHLQCAGPCCGRIWPARNDHVEVDPKTFRAQPPLPKCTSCDGVARPNILMFGDGGWHPERTHNQECAFDAWLEEVRGSALVVVELGAGTAVPTVRWHCEQTTNALDGTLIRINPREAHGSGGTICISQGALAALEQIDTML